MLENMLLVVWLYLPGKASEKATASVAHNVKNKQYKRAVSITETFDGKNGAN